MMRRTAYQATSAAAGAVLAVALVAVVAWPTTGHRPAGIVRHASVSASVSTADAMAGSALDRPDLTAYLRAGASEEQVAAFFADEFESDRHRWHAAVGVNMISRKLQVRFTPGAPPDEVAELRNVLVTSPLVDRVATPE